MLEWMLIETNELIYFALNIKQNLSLSKKQPSAESETQILSPLQTWISTRILQCPNEIFFHCIQTWEVCHSFLLIEWYSVLPPVPFYLFLKNEVHFNTTMYILYFVSFVCFLFWKHDGLRKQPVVNTKVDHSRDIFSLRSPGILL